MMYVRVVAHDNFRSSNLAFTLFSGQGVWVFVREIGREVNYDYENVCNEWFVVKERHLNRKNKMK
jgi:hypothetical protein